MYPLFVSFAIVYSGIQGRWRLECVARWVYPASTVCRPGVRLGQSSHTDLPDRYELVHSNTFEVTAVAC